MLRGPQPSKRSKRKKKQTATRTRAQTDYQKRKPTQTTTTQPQKAQDDFLDLFGSFSPNNNDETPSTTISSTTSDTISSNSTSSTTTKTKKKKKKERARAQTVTAKPTSTSASPTKSDKPHKKIKKIDILPLLHQGIRANKFKLSAKKSKVRTFYLTKSNFYFCWKAVQSPQTKKSLFGGMKSASDNKDKVDKDRSIPIQSIRSLQKNPAYMMKSYDFIPSEQKAFTLTIVYAVNGSEKTLNFMPYEAFHHMLFFEGLQDLINASRDSKRNLSEIFELYVDFPKEILPKHLRPQRFKWEPLQDNDFKKDDKEEVQDKNLYFDSNPNTQANVNIFDPTAAFGGRDRVKSF